MEAVPNGTIYMDYLLSFKKLIFNKYRDIIKIYNLKQFLLQPLRNIVVKVIYCVSVYYFWICLGLCLDLSRN